MLQLLKSKLTISLVIGLGLAMASTAVAAKLYIGAKEDLAAETILKEMAKATAEARLNELKNAERLRQAAEAARFNLLAEIEALKNQDVETITEIREVWRDREVIINNPVAVECAAEPMPVDVVRLLCESGTARTCANLQPST